MKSKEEKFDVFISYRREGGATTARLFYQTLTHMGYKVSFDMETLRSGKFNIQLYERIEECKDFVVILSKDSLVMRDNPEEDWFRLEIAHAIEHKKNIIPVFLRDFVAPQKNTLPDDVRDVLNYEGVAASDAHFDSTCTRLCNLFESSPQSKKSKRGFKYFLGAFLLCFIIAGGFYAYQNKDYFFPFPFTNEDKQHFSSITANIQMQGVAFDLLMQYQNSFLDEAERSVYAGTPSSFLEEYNCFVNSWRKLDIKNIEPSEELLNLVQKTPIMSGDYKNLYNFLKTEYEQSYESANFLKFIMDDKSLYSKSDRLRKIKLERENIKINSEIFSAYIMWILVKVSPAATEEFKREVATRWTSLPLLSGAWIRDEKTLKDFVEVRFNTLEKNIGEMESFLGKQNNLLRQEEKAYKDKLQDMGASKKEAEKMLEGNMKLVAIKTQIEEKKAIIKKKFAPSASDDAPILWGKVLRFLSVKMYDDAQKSLEFLRAKKSAEYPPAFCNAAEAFIALRGQGAFTEGVIVCLFEPPATSHAIFNIGDIVTQVNGKPCKKFEDYTGKVGTKYLIWRLNSDAKLVSHEAIMPANQPRMAIVNLSE